MSFPPPIPSEAPLEYATAYVDTRRPGIIIAIGVISIVFSVFYGIIAAVALMMAVGLSAAASAGPATVTVSTSTAGAAAPATQADALRVRRRELIIGHIESIAPLTPPRRDVLDAFLTEKGTDIDPRIATIETPDAAARLVIDTGTADDGRTFIEFHSGRLTIADTAAIFEPTGTTDFIEMDFAAATFKPGEPGFSHTPSTAVGPTGPTFTGPLFSKTGIALQFANGLMASALAVLLLAAGIFTLLSRPLGRRLHLAWAALKILGAFLGAVAVYWFYMDIMTSTATMTPGPSASTGISVMMALISLGLALLYPIAVLIVMNVRSVRNYLSSMT